MTVSRIARRLGERSERRFQKSPRGRATGPRYDFFVTSFSALRRPCAVGSRVARPPHARGVTVNADNLRECCSFPQRRQQLTLRASHNLAGSLGATYVTARLE